VVERRFGSGGSRLMEWNPDSTLKSVKTTNSAGTELTSNTYTYTGHGERAAQTGTVNGQTWSWNYQHDELGRLLLDNGPFGAGFRCDALDNRQQRITSVTEFAVHDAANRLVEIRSGSAGGPLLTVAHHDVDGQLVRLCDIRTGGTLSGTGASCTATGAGARQLELTWDASGRLSQVVVNGTTTYAYTYDHADRRLSKTVAGTTIHYAYDGDDLYARFTTGWSAPTSVTVHGGGVDEPLWELTGATSGPSANARYYHADGLGSVVALSAVSSGALTSERRYDAWGKVLP
jgi:YD repeat-containing protein